MQDKGNKMKAARPWLDLVDYLMEMILDLKNGLHLAADSSCERRWEPTKGPTTGLLSLLDLSKHPPITITDQDDDKKKALRPWLDLPDYIMEKILERLPLRSYIVFAAVCRQWRTIQRAHRLRHSPHPPPTSRPHPCILASYVIRLDPNFRQYYSPFDPTFYPLQLSGRATSQRLKCLGSSHGWLLFVGTDGPFNHPMINYQMFLFNPVSGACIQLPPPHSETWRSITSAMSAPPTEPQCAVLLGDVNDLYLHLLNTDNLWRQFSLPTSQGLRSVVYVGGKFYCISSGFKLSVVDPFWTTPVMFSLRMDCSQLAPELPDSQLFLVESNAEVLVVVPLYLDQHLVLIKGFQVFKADFVVKGWVRVESLGDRALFIARHGSFSLSAAEVGCRKNCIYYTRSSGTLNTRDDLNEAWKVFEVFDVETGGMTFGQPVPNSAIIQRVSHYDKQDLCWFVPKLDYMQST